jgi:ABC-type glycerol-3-phosphate transport system substrate-binding protein
VRSFSAGHVRSEKRRRSRLVVKVTVIVGLVAGLAGCGGGAPGTAINSKSASGPVKGGPLTVWLGGVLAGATPGSPMRAWYDKAVSGFEAQHPGTKVTTVYMNPSGSQQFPAFRAAFSSGKGPSVAMMYAGGQATQFSPYLANLREIAPDVVSRYTPTELSYGCLNYVCSGNAAAYLAPADFSQATLAYNKALFTKAGAALPTTWKTWNDFVAAAQKIKAAGELPIEMGNQEGYQSDFWLSPMYASYVTPADITALLKGQRKLTDPIFIKPEEAWDRLFADKLVNADACTLPEQGGYPLFLAGKAAMIMQYSPPTFYKQLHSNVGVTLLPPTVGTQFGSYGEVGEGWTITKLASNLPLAKAFLSYITTPDQNAGFFRASGLRPAVTGAKTDGADPLTTEAASLTATHHATSILGLDSVMSSQTQTTYFQQTALAFCGKESAQQAMQQVQSSLDQDTKSH